MNSGELPLKTRRKVSLAPDDGAGTESAADATRQAEAINRKKRKREVFIPWIRCAATRHALCRPAEFRLAIQWNLRRCGACAASPVHPDPPAQTAAGLVPSAHGTEPRPGHPRRPTAPVFRSSITGHG